MKQAISAALKLLRTGFLVLMCAGLFNLLAWFNLSIQPSYAVSTPEDYLSEIRKDQAVKDRQEAYKEATEIADDPKMGVEKEYEEEVNEYFEAHPDEAGIVQEAKGLVNQVTGKDK
jgi:hypothetical protein